MLTGIHDSIITKVLYFQPLKVSASSFLFYLCGMHTRTHTQTHTHMHARMPMHMHTCARAHTHSHTHTYIVITTKNMLVCPC